MQREYGMAGEVVNNLYRLVKTIKTQQQLLI